MYVIFEKDTGKVLGVSPKKEDENSILVDYEQVEGLILGREKRKNYRVEYDPKTKQLELKNLHLQSLDGVTINDFIYEIPATASEDPDITVEQDQKEKCWRITLGDSLKRNLRRQGIQFNSKVNFSVTKKHDPNILYKTLAVDFSKILQDNYAVLPFTMLFEHDDAEISIFTSRRFDTYWFERILDE